LIESNVHEYFTYSHKHVSFARISSRKITTDWIPQANNCRSCSKCMQLG